MSVEESTKKDPIENEAIEIEEMPIEIEHDKIETVFDNTKNEPAEEPAPIPYTVPKLILQHREHRINENHFLRTGDLVMAIDSYLKRIYYEDALRRENFWPI